MESIEDSILFFGVQFDRSGLLSGVPPLDIFNTRVIWPPRTYVIVNGELVTPLFITVGSAFVISELQKRFPKKCFWFERGSAKFRSFFW